MVKGIQDYLASKKMAWLAGFVEHSVHYLVGFGIGVIVALDLGSIVAPRVSWVLGSSFSDEQVA